MLDDWQFSQDLCEVHFHHSFVHFVPGLDLRARASRSNLTWVVLLLTADISSSIGLCHRSEAVFIYQGDEPWKQRANYNRAHRVDELDARKVHIIFCVLINEFIIVN